MVQDKWTHLEVTASWCVCVCAKMNSIAFISIVSMYHKYNFFTVDAGETALYVACKKNDVAAVKSLLAVAGTGNDSLLYVMLFWHQVKQDSLSMESAFG